ncbi:hypothetical protein IQ254_16330 [Nodosilinea sp. LEGE 07088]|uniref:hypothetical protein n=1 Tax=Nodosilinea sp. LEGE 07088 TaxID=2777968 RepID=UPI001881BB6F|nr:hypothetical protein [Nodosilinea sp. LEGE 07088]MBE9138742.1 hypothetical protein [Nodosilinea sp. LEGE 07088]
MSRWYSKAVACGALALGGIAFSAVAPGLVKADFTIAYCNGEKVATNIYRSGDPEAPSSALNMRLYARADRAVFLDTAANREPNPEGYNYSNIRGENQWTLFIANSPESPCTLLRNGEVYDQGTVTMREPPSTGL